MYTHKLRWSTGDFIFAHTMPNWTENQRFLIDYRLIKTKNGHLNVEQFTKIKLGFHSALHSCCSLAFLVFIPISPSPLILLCLWIISIPNVSRPPLFLLPWLLQDWHTHTRTPQVHFYSSVSFFAIIRPIVSPIENSNQYADTSPYKIYASSPRVTRV